jgi:hypothetical protein
MMKVVTHLAHVVFGLLTAIVSTISPVLSIINTILFIVYELNEEWYLEDEAYQEILEFSVGLAVGEMILILYKFLIPYF